MGSAKRSAFGLRKLIIFALNLASTLLTLFTGLRENQLLVLVTGRYDEIRARLLDGSINYNNTNSDLVDISSLLDLKEVGRNYRFYSQPKRGPHNFLTDRSTCLRMNSINVTRMNIVYDDFWGKGPRRSQVYAFSMSATNCEVVNFIPQWVTDECIATIGGNNETVCRQYIFDNFDNLKVDRDLHVGVESDFGVQGTPFLKCRGRPEREFNLNVDLTLQQSYWAGGSWHLEVLSSDCIARPLLRDSQKQFGLFSLNSADDKALAYSAAQSSGWLATIITALYAIVSVILIVRGMFTMVVRSVYTYYVPNAVRFKGSTQISLLKYFVPSMTLARLLPPSENADGTTSVVNSGIRLKGSLFMASDVWMNHWLYILLSMLDALANMRMTYVIFQLGTYMLKIRGSMETFLFMCSALGRMTWLLCFVHSITRWVLKLMIHSAQAFRLIRPNTRVRLDWYVDGTAMFVSYKLYSIELFVYMYLMLKIRKSTTFMVRLGKFGVYGGALKISQFWKSEAICDYTVVFTILISTTYLAMFLLLRLTRYKHVVNNRVMRILQARYVLVGWDAMVAMEALGIDPLNHKNSLSSSDGADDGMNTVAPANCSLGGLLQQLYTSGPSGLVHLAGDFIFLEGGFSREHPACRLPIKRATAIGLIAKAGTDTGFTGTTAASKKYNISSKRTSLSVEPDTKTSTGMSHRQRNGDTGYDDGDEADNAPVIKKATISLYERRLTVFADGMTGRILLVDEENEPGHTERRSGLVEFVVRDALSLTTILDIKPLLSNQKKLCIY